MSKLRFRVIETTFKKKAVEVATQYQTDLINNVYKIQSLFPAEKAARLSAKNLELIKEIADNQMWTLSKYRELLFIR